MEVRLAVVALGGNLGEPSVTFTRAVRAMDLLPGTRVLKRSGLYRTAPVGYASQPDFLNAAVLLETSLSPYALLGACLGIEAALGRVRLQKNGPRVLDLDLLLYEGCTAEEPELILPHPRMQERMFVLAPLSDLFPGGQAPGFLFTPPDDAARKASGVCWFGKWEMEESSAKKSNKSAEKR